MKTHTVTVTSARTGKKAEAQPIGFGPHPGTGKVAYISHGVSRVLQLRNQDDEIIVSIPRPLALDPNQAAGLVASERPGAGNPNATEEVAKRAFYTNYRARARVNESWKEKEGWALLAVKREDSSFVTFNFRYTDSWWKEDRERGIAVGPNVIPTTDLAMLEEPKSSRAETMIAKAQSYLVRPLMDVREVKREDGLIGIWGKLGRATEWAPPPESDKTPP